MNDKELKIAIMQPYFFPYIGYFQLMNTVDKFVIYDDVTFIKGGWINRNNILINNSPNLFTLPLKNASSNILIKDIEISLNDKWKNKFIKTIIWNYKKAPYFTETIEIISKILNIDNILLKSMCIESFELINKYLQIDTEIIDSSTIYSNEDLFGQDRVLDICIKENAIHYINPIGGLKIYNRKDFNDKGIKISFLETNQIKYSQFKNDFIPNLSIIDVMMFNSPNEIRKMLNNYKLI